MCLFQVHRPCFKRMLDSSTLFQTGGAGGATGRAWQRPTWTTDCERAISTGRSNWVDQIQVFITTLPPSQGRPAPSSGSWLPSSNTWPSPTWKIPNNSTNLLARRNLPPTVANLVSVFFSFFKGLADCSGLHKLLGEPRLLNRKWFDERVWLLYIICYL